MSHSDSKTIFCAFRFVILIDIRNIYTVGMYFICVDKGLSSKLLDIARYFEFILTNLNNFNLAHLSLLVFSI